MVINRRQQWWQHTTHIKNVSFYEHNIFTAITKDPDYVTAWISEITENINDHRLIIGLDTEWRASFRRGGENRVAILQLCVGHRCLIFQIIHAPYIPQSLIDFLNNPSYTFTGVGIHTDAEMLVRDYGLGRADDGTRLAANVTDVVWLAAPMNGNTINGLGLKSLAKMLLSMEPEKPKRVTLSKWGNQWLSPEQIDYACIDAFLSLEISRVLIT
ncbi:3'-5' exonuclease [Lactuca sativa]|uniref:3'-5' exonuclease n=1 Tax=Lactuca sativa TaxID=4236 RepID=UPI0022B07C08|nr:3'-5' exonuclease [Lactuca sativa]